MRVIALVGFLCVAVLRAAPAAAGEVPAPPVFDIPRLGNMTIDGKPDDWGCWGFRVDVLTDVAGKALPTANYDAAFRLGWDENGLLVLITVQDDVFLEPFTTGADLWKGDSIELFLATRRGGEDCFQVVFAPGCDPKTDKGRYNLSDYRKNEELKKTPLELKVKRTKTEHGFVLEVLLPWKNLGIEAKEGREIGFQLYANDSDKEGERFQLLWYPIPEPFTDPNRVYSLRLAAQPSPPVQATVDAGYDAEGRGQISMVAVGELKGKQVKVNAGDQTVGEGELQPEGSRAAAKISLPPPKDKAHGLLTVRVDDRVVGTVALPVAKGK
jgi:hypothetical protein